MPDRDEQTTRLLMCTIEDAFASTGTYLIRVPAGTILPAVELSTCSVVPMGSRPIGGYSIKSRVLVAFDPQFDFPVILGATPKALGDFRLMIPDSMVMRSRVGFIEDAMHYSEFSDPQSNLLIHSAAKPIDCLPGDWGIASDLGLSMFLGRTLASLKASDLAKIEAFWGDDLLRLVGYNYELFTAGLEDRRFNDEGEYSEVIRRTSYPWEGMGVREKGTNPTVDESGRLEPGSEKAKFEPKDVDQLIIPRQTILRGYLGDVEREIVSCPPDDLETENFEEETKHRGLLEVVKSSDGTLAMRSAKAIILEKYSLIPVPKEIAAPEDPNGDSVESGYMPAGDGEEVPEFAWGDETNPDLRSAQLFDYLAYTYGKYTTLGLVKHEKDWYYPNESELDKPVNGTVYDKGYGALDSSFSLPLPTVGTLLIDHRGGKDSIKYYQSRSCIAQLDDGSILLQDGYGSQIAMKGGNIFITCPGDVWTLPGRSAITWAPFDAVIRAGNSAELTASKKDVRIKAEKNLHMLGGNSGTVGGVLIESKSTGPSVAADYAFSGEQVTSHGITLKASDSSIHAFGSDIHIGLSPDSTGRIAIDADDKDIYMHAKDVFSELDGGTFAVLGKNEDNLLAVNANATIISNNTHIGGSVIIAPANSDSPADLIVGGSVISHGTCVIDGTVITNGSYLSLGSQSVGKIDKRVDLGTTKEQLGDDIGAQVTAVRERIEDVREQVKENDHTAPGHEEFQNKIGFSFRDSEEDLKLDEESFKIYEAPWQQIITAAGDQKSWEEPSVTAPNGDITMPHPGRKAWEEWESYATVELKNFEMSTGKSKDKDVLTEEGEEKQTASLTSYPVVKVPQ